MSILKIKGLTKNYEKITALKDLDLTLEKGNVYGLLGPNGSGKTTTLAIILGILSKDGGTYEWFDGQYGDKYRMKIGAILETPNFYPHLNAVKNLEIIAAIKGMDQKEFDHELEIVNLLHRKDSKFRTYSLGMKQRLAIAATLVGDPEVLIFDEPTNGLDPQGIAEVRNILIKVADSGKTVIMASHILSEVEKICSHVAIIKNGKLLSTGSVSEIIHKSNKVIEINATDREKLHSIVYHLPYVDSVKEKPDYLECLIDSSIKIEDLNQLLYEKGVIVNHLITRKRTLEEEFLEITSEK